MTARGTVSRTTPLAFCCLSVAIFAMFAVIPASCRAQATTLVATMAANEVAARQHPVHFGYISEERAPRTGGHLWREKVAETDDGPLRRLVAIDGRPLTPAETQVESHRIDDLVQHPDQFRRSNQANKNDESHATALLQLLPRAFLLTPDGEANGCTRFKFSPNPAFQPSSYEERVGHAMEGVVSLRQPMNRLCTLEGRISHPVEFGFGLLGRVDQGGSFTMERIPIDGTSWKTDRISVHLGGRILMLKTIAHDQNTVRTEIHRVPQNLTLSQAAQLTRP